MYDTLTPHCGHILCIVQKRPFRRISSLLTLKKNKRDNYAFCHDCVTYPLQNSGDGGVHFEIEVLPLLRDVIFQWFIIMEGDE